MYIHVMCCCPVQGRYGPSYYFWILASPQNVTVCMYAAFLPVWSCADVNSGSCAALEWKIFRGRSSWVTGMIFEGLFVLWNKTDTRHVFWLPALYVDCQERSWEGRVWGTWSLRCGCVDQHWRRKGLLFSSFFVNECYDFAPSNQHWSIVFYVIYF